MSAQVYILDEIVAKPRQAAAVRALYREHYIPSARQRGMVLTGEWQTPPMQDHAELPTRLYWLWSVDGVEGWWRQRFSRLPDGSDERFEKQAFWDRMATLIESRHRRMLSDQPEQGA